MIEKIKRVVSKKMILVLLGIVIAVLAIRHFFLQPAKVFESTKVARGNLEEKLTISGKIAADQDAVLTFQTGGQLAWVGVKEGDTVKKFQAIASLDQRQVQKNIQKYLNTYLKTRWDFDQTNDNYKDTVLTDAIKRVINKSQQDLNNSVLDVEIQDLTRQFANLWTPIDGIVVHADAPFAGVNVAPLTTSYEIVNPATVYFAASADQNEVIELKTGMAGTLILDPYSDKEISGRIDSVAFTPTSGSTDLVYQIKFIMDTSNTDYRYKIGMTGDVSFITNQAKSVLYLPSKFLKSEGNRTYVFTLKDGKRQKTYLETGLESEDTTEIKSGLREGETVYE